MYASIYQGTKYEIKWSIDEAINPELVDRIREAGNEQQINWNDSKFTEGLELLCEKWTKSEIKDKLYDEDPDLIEILALVIQNPHEENHENSQILVRLYLPVFIVILDFLDC